MSEPIFSHIDRGIKKERERERVMQSVGQHHANCKP